MMASSAVELKRTDQENLEAMELDRGQLDPKPFFSIRARALLKVVLGGFSGMAVFPIARLANVPFVGHWIMIIPAAPVVFALAGGIELVTEGLSLHSQPSGIPAAIHTASLCYGSSRTDYPGRCACDSVVYPPN